MNASDDRDKILKWISSLGSPRSAKTKSPFSVLVRPHDLGKLNAYNFSVLVRHKKMTATGTSLRFIQKDAFFGAFCEAVERLALRDPRAGYNSNGVALHTNPKEARTRAAREVIERHLFLAHYWGGVPFFKPDKSIAKSKTFIHTQQALRSHYAKFEIYEMQRVGNLRSFIAVISDLRKHHRFGLALGCSTKESAQEAAESALCEALNVFHIIKLDRKKMNLEKFLRLKSPTPHDHALLAWNINYSNESKHFFAKSQAKKKNIPIPLSLKSFRFRKLKITAQKDFPFCVYKATHPKLLDMVFHHLTESDHQLIIRKLNDFWMPKTKFSAIPSLPHPFP
mgnify:CR=1 FL=1